MTEAIICQAFSRIYGPLSLVKLVCTDAYQMRRNRPGKLQLSGINSNISLSVLFFLTTIIMTVQFSGFCYISAVGEFYYYERVFCCAWTIHVQKNDWIFDKSPQEVCFVWTTQTKHSVGVQLLKGSSQGSCR